MDVFEEVILPIVKPMEILIDTVISAVTSAQEATQSDFALVPG